jgi:Uma2 family endonuclease
MVAIPNAGVEKRPYISPQEYLERERISETKSEYYDGVIVAMAGASWVHNLISSRTGRFLGNQLENALCEAITNDMKVWVEACRKFFYPDVLVVCGEPQFHDAHQDYLTNPTCIVEVLSPSTELNHRGDKFICYQSLNTLTTYVLVSQDTPRIEYYTRQPDDFWRYTRLEGLDAVVMLDALGCELRLADVYAGVPFPAPEDAEARSDSPETTPE